MSPEVFDLTPNAITATQPWETDSSALALTAASLLNELRPLVAAALDWDDACRHSPGSTLADVTATRNALASSLDALSEDAHVWARGESLVDDAPPTFAVGPAPESVFDSEDGDQLGAACCGSGFLVHPGDRAVAAAGAGAGGHHADSRAAGVPDDGPVGHDHGGAASELEPAREGVRESDPPGTAYRHDAWWVVHADVLRSMLDRARAGEDPGVLYVELIANSEATS